MNERLLFVCCCPCVVVALFNAISQARVDAAPEQTGEEDGKPTKKAKAKAALAADKKSKIKSLTKDLFANSMKSDVGGGSSDMTGADKTALAASTNGQWNALRDDYMLDKGMKLKVSVSVHHALIYVITVA